jgi:putative drug exporter of the RND superfamily
MDNLEPGTLASLARWVCRYRVFTLGVSCAFMAASLAVLWYGGSLTSGKIEGLESGRAQALAAGTPGQVGEMSVIAIFRPKVTAAPMSLAEVQAEMGRILAPLQDDARVKSILAPTGQIPVLEQRMTNAQKSSAFAIIDLAGDFEAATRAYPAILAQLESPNLEVSCTGQVPFMHDLDRTLEHDLLRAELVSLPIAIVVLLLVFGGLVAALIPVAVGSLAVAGGIAIVMLMSHITPMAVYTINLCSLIGLGVAIDYSLFIVSRYREELALGHETTEAIVRAVSTAGRAVAFSGLAVAVGLSGLLFFQGSFLVAMGIGGAIVVALAVIFALTFLPALLAVLGPVIHFGRVPLPGRGASSHFWNRTARQVMKRPVPVLVFTLSLLILLGIPFLHLRITTADVRVLEQGVQSRDAYELLGQDFPDQGATRIVVAIELPQPGISTAAHTAAFSKFGEEIAQIPHVRKVESQSGDRVALIEVFADAPPESEEARGIVRSIRQLREEWPSGGGSILVGGVTANDIDSTAYIAESTPYAVGFVVFATIVVLFLLLRSVVLPLKAVIMNFLSMAGSFGALVWVFQDGHLFVTDPRPLEPTLPVLLFCMLFGLSMDYEVLMLSRIKESYERTHDNIFAVADGLEKTAGLITGAAAIMVAVFGAFALAQVVLVRAVGFGMALAVLLDATIVRVLLVPATMRLFGHMNWWAPRWMGGKGAWH